MLAFSSVAAMLLLFGAVTIHDATKVSEADFGKMPNGAVVHIFTLTNEHGVEARICTYGGAVVSLKTPDRPSAPTANGCISASAIKVKSLRAERTARSRSAPQDPRARSAR